MGKLTDLLHQKGLLDGDPGLEPNQQEKARDPIPLSEKFQKENLIDELKEALQELSEKPLSKKKVFERLPTLGDFYIPQSMNGRVIECSDSSFQPMNNQKVVRAKAYSFDGYEVKYLFYDPADGTLQRGNFDEFPRDSFGRTMGHVGLQGEILCWIKKNFQDV